MNELTRYETAKRALAECRSVDEIKDIRDKAMAMKLYAAQARDRALEEDALEIRLRAERRLGELMKEMPKAKGGEHGGKLSFDGVRDTPSNPTPTLASAGIDKNLAKRARKLAELKVDDFEDLVKEVRTTLRNPKPVIEPEDDDASTLINYLTAHNFKLHNLRQSQLRSLERSLRALLDKVVLCLQENLERKQSSSQPGEIVKEEKESVQLQDTPQVIEFPSIKHTAKM